MRSNAFTRSGMALALMAFVATAVMTAHAAELVSAAISADVPSLDPIYDNSPVAANVRLWMSIRHLDKRARAARDLKGALIRADDCVDSVACGQVIAVCRVIFV